MMNRVIVDTSVLHKANDPNTSENWDAIAFLTRLPGAMCVYVDAEDHVFEEYKRTFAPGIQSISFQWWRRQSTVANGVHTVSGNLTTRQLKVFKSRGCDNDDMAFIGVALRAGAPDVHEDGDYEEPCARALGVVGHRVSDACQVLGL